MASLSLTDLVADELRKSAHVITAIALDADLVQRIAHAAELCIMALRKGDKIMFAGNGGSAADAQHLAAELVSRFNFDRPGLAGIALTTDTSALTAIGNDYGFEKVFARQIDALGHKNDILIAISTSGNSPNIIEALSQCSRKGIFTIGMTGQSGGKMMPLCDVCLRMPSDKTPKIQEGHIVVGHILCQLIERGIFDEEK
jgi:D-sedoheptulose 7-phosphate isomerase